MDGYDEELDMDERLWWESSDFKYKLSETAQTLLYMEKHLLVFLESFFVNLSNCVIDAISQIQSISED